MRWIFSKKISVRLSGCMSFSHKSSIMRMLISKNYVLPATSLDIPGVPAFERGIELGLNPAMMEKLQWQMYVVSAALITEHCRSDQLA